VIGAQRRRDDRAERTDDAIVVASGHLVERGVDLAPERADTGIARSGG
jgi:hypothetical protein